MKERPDTNHNQEQGRVLATSVDRLLHAEPEVLVRADYVDVLASVRSLLMKMGLGGTVGFLLMLVAIFWAGAGQRKEDEGSMQAERSLRESEMRTGNVMENALDDVVMMDREGRLSGSLADATGIDRTLRERS